VVASVDAIALHLQLSRGIPGAEGTDLLDDRDADITSLELRVRAMRRLGVVRWSDIELGPDPLVEASPEQPHVSPEAREKQERADRRTLALAASGGLVRRLDGT
jgi:hypothetical protein